MGRVGVGVGVVGGVRFVVGVVVVVVVVVWVWVWVWVRVGGGGGKTGVEKQKNQRQKETDIIPGMNLCDRNLFLALTWYHTAVCELLHNSQA